MKNSILTALFLSFLGFTQILPAQDGPSFHQFLDQFPSAQLPYCVNGLPKAPEQQAAILDWEFYAFLPELEQTAAYHNMPVHPQPMAKFETENHVAVLYNLVRGAGNKGQAITISVFDKQGNYLSTHFLAGTADELVLVAVITPELEAEVLGFVKGKEKKCSLQSIASLKLIWPGNPLAFRG